VIRSARLGVLLAVLVLVQITVLTHVRIAGAVPDLGLVATLAVAYRLGPEAGAVFGFAAGAVTDLFLQTPFGLSALAWVLTGYLAGVVQEGLVRSAWWVPPVFGGVGALVGGAVFLAVGALVGQEQLWTARSFRLAVAAAGYAALVSPLVFTAVRAAVRDPGARVGSPGEHTGW
jgi:rod shape-determining protein MreD